MEPSIVGSLVKLRLEVVEVVEVVGWRLDV